MSIGSGNHDETVTELMRTLERIESVKAEWDTDIRMAIQLGHRVQHIIRAKVNDGKLAWAVHVTEKEF